MKISGMKIKNGNNYTNNISITLEKTFLYSNVPFEDL